jgi:unsaturated rhamnogalacturonyl hydrolase
MKLFDSCVVAKTECAGRASGETCCVSAAWARVFFRLAVLILLPGIPMIALSSAFAEERPWSERVANAALERWPEGRFVPPGQRWVWNYELGTLLEGMDALWLNTADPRYYNYIKTSVDQFVGPDGSIPTLNVDEYQLDNILMGRQLLLLYGVTRDPRYAKAATLLCQQLAHQPRTASGGFWHKQRYPNQMWLDGLYMAEPFYAEYASTFHHTDVFNDITHQFALIDEHARDAKTGLLYHGWDESKQERWADKATGVSSQFWARAMGWTMMALVDTIPCYPEGDAGRQELLAQLARDAAAVARYQDGETGLWYQVLDKAGTKGNFLEASASGMFVYALAKGVRLGYLPPSYLANAEHGYKGILSHFIQAGPGDSVSLTGTVKVGGLGGDPYRDGSYSYYIGEKTITDDPKGVGAFLMASSEMENAQGAKLGRGDTVIVDAWFNSQQRPNAFGQRDYFHYKWDDQSNDGYSLLGHIIRNFGAETETLYTAPTVSALGHAQVYIIASPDTVAKNPSPHFVQPEDGAQIAEWVRGGGMLVILANDPANTDLEHFNLIAGHFGIHFNSVLRKHVLGNSYEMGQIKISGGGPIFHNPHTLFMKDVCSISVTSPAVSAFEDNEGILMATAKYGKGTIFATVDPWLYNEYTDGRKLSASYDNFAAGKELVQWILAQIPHSALSQAPLH